jgi:GAF domain-containing protein
VDDRAAPDQGPRTTAGRTLLDAVPVPVLLVSDDGTLAYANPAAAEALRAPVGQPLVAELFEEPQQGAAAEVIAHALGSGRWEGELTLVGRDRTTRPATLAVTRLPQDAGGGVMLVVEDLGGSKRRARRVAERLTRLTRVTAELLHADDLESVTKVVIEHMADAAGATVASLSVPLDADTLRLLGIRGGRVGVESRWQTFPAAGTPAGEALLSREPVLLGGRDEIARRYPDLERAAEGERSILSLPLLVGDKAVGVATLSFPGRRSLDAAELEFFRVLADTCAQAVDRVQALVEAADRASKLRFLADATAELTRSLDYEVTLTKVARLAVPWFADWCTIAVALDGELRTLAVAHVDPAKVALAEEFERRFPPDPTSSSGSYRVFHSGRSELTPDITPEMIDAAVAHPDQRALLHELDLRSAMSVPLKVKDRVLGVVTWVAGSTGRRYTVQDLAFGEDLAGRAAVAIDNAQLHTELRDMAMRLQRAVLPAALPRVEGWELAAHYSPSGRLEAGGDFYDVIRLDDDRLVVFVGDVMGRGVHAAAAMAQMRASIRALVAVDPRPEVVLRKLDLLFETYDIEQLVTMVYAVADPDRDVVEVVNAGHPVPLVRGVDGTVRALPSTDELLLGAGNRGRTSRVVGFGPGETLLLFTDGLIERRDEDIDVGQRRLVDALAAEPPHLAGSLHATVLRLVDEVRDRSRDDDLAVLAVRRFPARRAVPGGLEVVGAQE